MPLTEDGVAVRSSRFELDLCVDSSILVCRMNRAIVMCRLLFALRGSGT